MSWSYLLESENLTREQLRKCNVSELQSILNQLSLPSNGKKHELVERLYQFWQSIQTPASNTNKPIEHVNPTTSLSFTLPLISDIVKFRAKLEMFGPILTMLFDPSENTCYVSFRTLESAEQLYDNCQDLDIENATYIPDNEIEKKSKQLQLLAENMQPHNTIQKTFRKTNFEPRLFWCPCNTAYYPEQ